MNLLSARPAVCLLLLAAGCTYLDTPDGRYLNLNLPVESRHTVHKTVHIYAPPGTTVIYGERDIYPDAAYPRLPPNAITLRSAADGGCLDAARPGYLNTVPCHGRHSQRFSFDGFLLRTAGGLCLDSEHGLLQTGSRAVAAPCRRSPSQQWHHDGYSIRSRTAPLCLDNLRPGGPLRLTPCRGSRSQRFVFGSHPY
ncbi:MAG: ricin-type beta-trefoil lectin domain protein [Eikenella sp.]|nr:ricin-type beta-trefoil lectin domain protein [Eikenella sp.]